MVLPKFHGRECFTYPELPETTGSLLYHRKTEASLYPSISGSFIFTEYLKTLSWLNFGKLRVGYAEVGSDGDVALMPINYTIHVNATLINNPAGTPVALGTSGTTVPNPNLKPSRVNETELGMELKMFDSRVNLDVAVYKKLTLDQIVSVQVSDASGFLNTRSIVVKAETRALKRC